MDNQQTIQHLIGVHEGAAAVAEEALSILVLRCGADKDEILSGIETKLISKYKNSDILPEYELKHADVVKPVLDEIQRLLNIYRNN